MKKGIILALSLTLALALAFLGCKKKGECEEGQTQPCYTGLAGTQDVGVCRAGTQTCTAGAWGECVDAVTPGTEECDGLDNDCNGQTDENLTKSCYEGPAGTEGVGVCKGGTQTCSAGSWGSCAGQVLPSPETPGDSLDNDCNGQVDEAAAPAPEAPATP